ncbi:MAG TPA: helix-turn-helix domain-containing protein [Candidatus Limnocylindrales bacterium]|jgi:excisionase family DNA binding protein
MASMAIQDIGPMLTASEVADLLHLHVNTVKRLGDRGELPFYRVCKRGDRRFRYDDVLAFLQRNK